MVRNRAVVLVAVASLALAVPSGATATAIAAEHSGSCVSGPAAEASRERPHLVDPVGDTIEPSSSALPGGRNAYDLITAWVSRHDGEAGAEPTFAVNVVVGDLATHPVNAAYYIDFTPGEWVSARANADGTWSFQWGNVPVTGPVVGPARQARGSVPGAIDADGGIITVGLPPHLLPPAVPDGRDVPLPRLEISTGTAAGDTQGTAPALHLTADTSTNAETCTVLLQTADDDQAASTPSAPAAARSHCGHTDARATAGAPSSDNIGMSATPCSGVRPGGKVFLRRTSGDEGQCTLNFLFTHTDDDGNVMRYVGTAGHCVIPSYGDVVGPMAPAWAVDAFGNRELIGHAVYAVVNDSRDFALIALDAGVEVDPQTCYWGGPTGISDARDRRLDDPRALRHYGHGMLVGDLSPARTGYATDFSHEDSVFMTGMVTPGDSGGPVLHTDGRAVGVAVAIGGMRLERLSEGHDSGFVKVQRLPFELERANRVLGTDLQLVTAPLG